MEQALMERYTTHHASNYLLSLWKQGYVIFIVTSVEGSNQKNRLTAVQVQYWKYTLRRELSVNTV
jgi:hypothetical protein